MSRDRTTPDRTPNEYADYCDALYRSLARLVVTRNDPPECRALALLRDGFGVSDAARVLGVSTSTVHRQIHRMHKLLGTTTLPQLVAAAIAEGLIDMPPPKRHHANPGR